MSVKEILRLGNPLLRQVAAPVSLQELTSPEFQELITDMQDTMSSAGGIGIAAPQIGISKQVCLVSIDTSNPRYNIDEDYVQLVIINPVITVLEEQPIGMWEGCLSVPGLRGFVERPSKISLTFTDQKGVEKTAEFDGLMAIVIQHELDHLFGKLYVDLVKSDEQGHKMISYLEEFSQFIVPNE